MNYKLITYICCFLIINLIIVFSQSLRDSIHTLTNPTPQATYQSDYKINQEGRVAVGAFLNLQQSENATQTIKDFEDISQKRMQNLLVFLAWEDALVADQQKLLTKYLNVAAKHGLDLTLTWEPWQRNYQNPGQEQPKYDYQEIIAGEFDEYIAQTTRLIANYPHVDVSLRFAHEMNTPTGLTIWYPWQGDPEGYVAAFQYLHKQMRSAENIKFMWNPFLYQGAASVTAYYPGDVYVDEIGMSVINLGTMRDLNGNQQRWRECDELIDEQYQVLAQYNKNIQIVEIMSSNIGGDRSNWYDNCLEKIANKPLITGINFMQIDSRVQWTLPATDWRINADSEVLSVVRKHLATNIYQ